MRFISIITMFFSVIVFYGCSSSSLSLKQNSTGFKNRDKEKTIIQLSDVKKGSTPINSTFLDTINRENELSLSENDFQRDVKMATSSVSGNIVPELLYRIQVFASNRIETVREQKKELEKNTDEPVFIGYEPPYYKLYAGEFAKRQDAQLTLQKLKKNGYADAWVVSTKNNP